MPAFVTFTKLQRLVILEPATAEFNAFLIDAINAIEDGEELPEYGTIGELAAELANDDDMAEQLADFLAERQEEVEAELAEPALAE